MRFFTLLHQTLTGQTKNKLENEFDWNCSPQLIDVKSLHEDSCANTLIRNEFGCKSRAVNIVDSNGNCAANAGEDFVDRLEYKDVYNPIYETNGHKMLPKISETLKETAIKQIAREQELKVSSESTLTSTTSSDDKVFSYDVSKLSDNLESVTTSCSSSSSTTFIANDSRRQSRRSDLTTVSVSTCPICGPESRISEKHCLFCCRKIKKITREKCRSRDRFPYSFSRKMCEKTRRKKRSFRSHLHKRIASELKADLSHTDYSLPDSSSDSLLFKPWTMFCNKHRIQTLKSQLPNTGPVFDSNSSQLSLWPAATFKQQRIHNRRRKEKILLMAVSAIAIATFLSVSYFGTILFLRITRSPFD